MKKSCLPGFPTLALVFALLSVVVVQMTYGQATSTPEEQARWVEIIRKLESNPLDKSLNKDGELALRALSQATEAHNIHVPLCPRLLGDFNDRNYHYFHEITRQYMLASAAFMIENPDGVHSALNLAAVQSVLKAYSAILHQKPYVKSKRLDDLLKNQSQGKLEDSLRKLCP